MWLLLIVLVSFNWTGAFEMFLIATQWLLLHKAKFPFEYLDQQKSN